VITELLALRLRLRAGPRGPVSPLGRFGDHPQSPAFYYDPRRESSPAGQPSLTQKHSDNPGAGLSAKTHQGKAAAGALWILALAITAAIGVTTLVTHSPKPACASPPVVQTAPAPADTFKAQVLHVVDGDTIHISAGGQETTVRLMAVDCPESGQRFGEDATRLVSELTSGKQVIVRGSEHDKYGRLLADVILLDGCDLSLRLVASGNAWWYRKYAPNDKALEILENEARQAKRGLWADSSPIPPWEFRHGPPTASTPSPNPMLSPTAHLSPAPTSQTVYITTSGKKYHREDCRYLSKSKIPISLDDAKQRGYTPCKVCNPPE